MVGLLDEKGGGGSVTDTLYSMVMCQRKMCIQRVTMRLCFQPLLLLEECVVLKGSFNIRPKSVRHPRWLSWVVPLFQLPLRGFERNCDSSAENSAGCSVSPVVTFSAHAADPPPSTQQESAYDHERTV